MGRTVIVGYRPKPGMAEELEALVSRHWDTLRAQALVSARAPHRMRAADGTLVEVFEWLSPQSIERAHHNAAVQAMWSQFAVCCDYVPVGSLAESGHPFAEFDSLSARG